MVISLKKFIPVNINIFAALLHHVYNMLVSSLLKYLKISFLNKLFQQISQTIRRELDVLKKSFREMADESKVLRDRVSR